MLSIVLPIIIVIFVLVFSIFTVLFYEKKKRTRNYELHTKINHLNITKTNKKPIQQLQTNLLDENHSTSSYRFQYGIEDTNFDSAQDIKRLEGF